MLFLKHYYENCGRNEILFRNEPLWLTFKNNLLSEFKMFGNFCNIHITITLSIFSVLNSYFCVMFTENEIRFQCRLRRGTLDFRDDTTFELVQFNGYLSEYFDN